MAEHVIDSTLKGLSIAIMNILFFIPRSKKLNATDLTASPT